jgi:hypothetical protein
MNPDRPRGARAIATRVLLGALTTLVSVNLWTGGPLLALWVGSRIQASVGQPSMAAIGATVGILLVESFVLYKLLTYLNVAYYRAIGRRIRRRQTPWLKSQSGERGSTTARQPLSATERIVVASVVLAVLALEVWFFAFAHYTLPG